MQLAISFASVPTVGEWVLPVGVGSAASTALEPIIPEEIGPLDTHLQAHALL